MQRRNLVLTALYKAHDDRWIHLHGGFPHLAAGTRSVLGVADDADRDTIRGRLAARSTLELEDTLAEGRSLRGDGADGRRVGRASAGRALAGHGRVVVTKLADGEPRPAGTGARPLSGTACST